MKDPKFSEAKGGTLLSEEITYAKTRNELGPIDPFMEEAPTLSELDAELAREEALRKSAVIEQETPRFPSWKHENTLKAIPIESDETLEGDSFAEIPIDAPPDLIDNDPAKKTNIFYRLKQKKEAEEEKRLGEVEWIRKKHGLSDEDIILIFELGYDDELGRIVGYEDLKKLKTDYQNRYCQPGYKHYRTAFGYSGSETADTQTLTSVLAKYLHDRTTLIFRTVLTAITALLLLFLDYPSLSGNTLITLTQSYPLLIPLLSLCLLLAVSALSYKQLNAGLRSFLKATPTPYSVPAITLLLVILYDLSTLFLWGKVLHVNMLTASLLVVLALCDVLRIRQEMRAIQLLATDEEKTVLEPAMPRRKKLKRENKTIKILNDDDEKSFYRIRRATHVTGFFRRFNTTETAHLPFQFLICLCAGFSFVVGFIGAVAYPSLSYGFSCFVTTLFISAPSTAMFSFFYPLYRANKILSARNCVLLGNESVNEFAAPKTLIFDDTDLYNAEKRAELFVEDSDDLRSDMKLAGALFRSLGGTLNGLGKTIGVVGEDPEIVFVRISDKGVEALADNETRMIAGSADYLKKAGIRVPHDDTERALRRTKGTATVYIAINGVLKFTYEIEYTQKLSFLSLCEDLATINTTVAIESYDPSLNDGFIQISNPTAKTKIRVIKPGRYEKDTLLETCDSGAVAVGDKYAIVYPLHAAYCVRESKRFGMRLQWFSLGLGILLSAIFALFPEINILTPLSVAVYHGAFLLFFYLVTHLSINRHTLRISRFF